MASITGGELVVRELRKAGIDRLFGLHGANIDTIFQACMDAGMPIVDTRHEMNAGHAAEGYARITQGLGVALVTAGGGMTNVVTSMANALLDRTPVLYLCGSGMLKSRQTNTLQHDIDQVALGTPVTKWAHHVTCVDQIPRLVAQAVRIAMQAPRGPVMLDLPWDVLMASVEEDDLPDTGTNTLRSCTIDAATACQVVDMLVSAKRPAIVLGSEAARGSGRETVERIAAATGVPVFTEFEAAALLRDLPDNVNAGLLQGLYGLGDQAPDVIVMAGMRFGLYTAHGSGTLIPHDARIVQIDPDARELGRLQSVELGIVADVGPALQALADAAEQPGVGEAIPAERSQWQDTVRAHVKRRYDAVAANVTRREGVLHPFTASEIVAEHVDTDVTVVADGALTYLWLSETVAAARPRALLFHSHLSSMGCGFGIAVGAQAGAGADKRVILVTGDGAAGYSLGEFDTLVRNGLPLIVIVMNNRSWGATLHFQQIVVGANRVTGTLLENGRYEQAATAFGVTGYFADSAESLREALATAMARNEPACINVLVDLDPIPPEELVVMGMDPFTPPSEQTFG
ncbi:thiamine pyrophosphate-binding protein [Croceicoccus bisphenolivorans]|uniref:thiamine pyrophosphate-binding protein n=1 Tax=Croceicoccus bisphenolivorans TaxID=1783232 RepID=UPI0008378F4C|nr:thiamine pyrophosphate-binding protein [Croceicoccus bisphenolivorans]